jgi:ribonucleoside-diphosphate reductase beta chain
MTVDNSKEPIFFGAKLGLQRYDNPKYQTLYNYVNKMMLFFWRAEEISLNKDRADFKDLSEHEKFIFTKNLGYQILLDSVQSRGVNHLLEHCSSTEVEAVVAWWGAFETLHSQSYTYIIKNVYANPTQVLDEIAKDEAILNRATGVTKYYDDMINNLSDSVDDQKKALYLTLVSIQILEAVRFYISFACSYYFAEQGKMSGNALIIKLINRDENLHLGFTKTLLNILHKNEDEGFIHIVKECEPIVQQMWKDAAEEESAWAEYLFEQGDLLGLNAEILKQYMKFLVNQRMKLCGFKPIFEKTSNPITWIDKWIDSKEVQNAPQEQENTSYLTNAIDANSFEGLGDMSV